MLIAAGNCGVNAFTIYSTHSTDGITVIKD